MTAKYESPFAPFQLSRYETDQLEELARVVVGQVMDQFETHISDPMRFVDPTRWKLTKQRENILIYKELSKRRQRRATCPTPTTKDSAVRPFAFSVTSEDLVILDGEHSISHPRREDHPPEYDDESSDLPILMSVGTLPGDLNDIMYGVANPTTELMRIKTAYIQDGIVNSAVLARLKEPTADDPFRSLTIKWCVKGQALHLRTLVNNRDLVYLEATGLGRLPRSGELVGYQMLHSGCMRGNLSIVGLYRQHRDGVVETFGKGFVNPTGPLVRALMVKSASDVMLSSWRTMHTAQMKKLAYAVRRRHSEWPLLHQRHKQPSSDKDPSRTKAVCPVCKQPATFLVPFAFTGRTGSHPCRLCERTICGACHVPKRLASISPNGTLSTLPVSFCVDCVAAVTAASDFDIAVNELVRKDTHQGYGSVASSLSPTETIADRFLTADSLLGSGS